MIDNYVTGSSGFIGKHLVSKLSGKTVTIPHGKIMDYKFRDFRRFYFLSTYGNMADHKDPLKILEANIAHLRYVIESILEKKLNCDSFVFTSSSSVLLPVQTQYSVSKRAAEDMLKLTSLPYCIIRPYTVIGVGEQKAHLIPTLIRSCLEGWQIEFVPDATHDYIDVDDVVRAMLTLSKEKSTGIFELGKGIAITNQEVLDIVEEVTGKKANITVVDQLREYDSRKWCCKITGERWPDLKPLRKSIEEMVEDYQYRVCNKNHDI